MRKFTSLILAIASFNLVYSQNLTTMFRKPGAIGDSLSQGFYGVIVEKKITGLGISSNCSKTSEFFFNL